MPPKPPPPNTMVELTTELIDEGRLLKQLNEAIKEAHAALVTRREAGQTGGSCTVTATINLGYDPDMREIVGVEHCVTLKTPKNVSRSLVKEKGDRLLCQPTGSCDDDPMQTRLFDAQGRPIGMFDPETGEVHSPSAVAGKVGI